MAHFLSVLYSSGIWELRCSSVGQDWLPRTQMLAESPFYTWVPQLGRLPQPFYRGSRYLRRLSAIRLRHRVQK